MRVLIPCPEPVVGVRTVDPDVLSGYALNFVVRVRTPRYMDGHAVIDHIHGPVQGVKRPCGRSVPLCVAAVRCNIQPRFDASACHRIAALRTPVCVYDQRFGNLSRTTGTKENIYC